MKDKIFNTFNDYWTPIYKRMYFKARLLNNTEEIKNLKDNLFSNWNLTLEQKEEIWNDIIGGKNEKINY